MSQEDCIAIRPQGCHPPQRSFFANPILTTAVLEFGTIADPALRGLRFAHQVIPLLGAALHGTGDVTLEEISPVGKSTGGRPDLRQVLLARGVALFNGEPRIARLPALGPGSRKRNPGALHAEQFVRRSDLLRA